MSQPTPRVTPTDVEHVVKRDFPRSDHGAVSAMLEEYGRKSWQREADRVRLAVLRLAERDLQRLRQSMDIALADYRDVLSYAEYPDYSRRVHPGRELSPKDIRGIVEADWEQYQTWLNRERGNQGDRPR